MEKSYSGRYPELKYKQFDFLMAVTSMLNCRKYLESQGFEENFDSSYHATSISGTVVFPDGSIADNMELASTKNTNERDSLLERMIDKKAVFKRIPVVGSMYFYYRDKIIRTTFENNGYDFRLSVVDTTRKRAIIPVRWFLTKPREFAFQYDICLRKGIVNDSDLTDFEKYKSGLEMASKCDSPAICSPSPNTVVKPDVKVEVIDPWAVDFDRLNSLRTGGRKWKMN